MYGEDDEDEEGKGEKDHLPGASIQTSRVPPRQLSHSSKIPTRFAFQAFGLASS
jgi:hypothetical protein